VRQSGLAFDREEHELGIISIAAPILREEGQPLGAVSIATSKSRHSTQSLKAFGPALMKTVALIAKEAEAQSFPQAD
ncbi:MAG: IclR family transcriptional regulator C-terminal domain-containing protein, partial [Pseudomonadota bacterium]